MHVCTDENIKKYEIAKTKEVQTDVNGFTLRDCTTFPSPPFLVISAGLCYS